MLRKPQKCTLNRLMLFLSFEQLKKEKRKTMNKTTLQNAIKRVQQEARIAKTYAMPIINKDMIENNANVKKFFESIKK